MTIPALSVLTDSYKTKLQTYYAQYQADQTTLVKTFWQSWLDPGIAGIESASPFTGSKATTTASSFSPLPLEGASSPAAVAAVLATAWQNYMEAITWPTMAPVAPFSAITSVVTSPSGLAAAYATLLAGLTAELATMPAGDTDAAFSSKGQAFGQLFQTATISAGIQISGLSTSAPPAPLVVPLSPIQ